MPRIAIGSDHAGYELKQHVIGVLTKDGHDVVDVGTYTTESCDYPQFCAAVGRAVRDGNADVGIVLGGSGQGEQLAANKVHGVRAALCNDLFTDSTVAVTPAASNRSCRSKLTNHEWSTESCHSHPTPSPTRSCSI